VKDQWFHVRLLEGRCGGALATDEYNLEALDGYLGEHHDCVLLHAALIGDVLLPRKDAAHVLRLIRRYRGELRRGAQQLGARIYTETPRQFVDRIRRARRSAEHQSRRSRCAGGVSPVAHRAPARRVAEARTSWPQVA
jgi:hypothetical protein